MFNLVVLSGRLTADPELKTTPNGVSVTSFNIANEVGYGENRKTSFISIVAWRGTAEFITKNFTKGSLIGIEGAIQTRKYVDRDGNNRTAFEVVANNVQFVLPKSASTSVSIECESNSSSMGEKDPMQELQDKIGEFEELTDSDLPF
jgi:single-strand DNA-binding protein